MPLPRFDGSVFDNVPRPVPGASIYVLSQPTTSLVPPYAPLATIYSDPDGTTPIDNPFNADGSGNYFFYAAAGLYTIAITGGSLAAPYILADQALLESTSGVTLRTNGTNNSTQTLLNLVAGSNVTLSESAGAVTINGAAGAITLQTNGTNNSSQSNLNLTSGTGITLTAGSGGVVTINSTSGATFQVNGTNVGDQTLINLASGPGVSIVDGGTGTLTFSAVPVYNASGSTLSGAKIVQGSATLSGGTATVTLSGSAVFSNTSYQVISNLPVSIVSTSQFTINGVDTPAGVLGLNITSNVLTVTTNQLFSSGQTLAFTSMSSGASFLNGVSVNVSTASASGSNFIFTASYTHANYGLNATISNVALTSNVVTITTSAAHTFTTGSIVAISGVGTATWLNGQTLTITGTTSTTFTAAFTHADYPSAADTGTVADADNGYVGLTLSGTVPWIAIGS